MSNGNSDEVQEVTQREETEEIGERQTTAEDDEQQDKRFLEFMASAFSTATEKTLKVLNKKNKLDNVAIFIDYDNVYWTLNNQFSHDPDHEDPEKNLFTKLWSKYGQSNVRTFRAYADFEKVKTELTSLQKKRVQIRHVYSNGKDGDNRKNSSDIELCIDAIEHTYKDPNVTCYVFVTADSDMIPIISRMMYKNKHVELYYLSSAAPQHVDITSFVQRSEDLLTFLNVEVKTYDINEYIFKALVFISDWQKYYNDSDLYLGVPWLRGQFAKNFGITASVSSELIEKLKLEDLIIDGRKKMKNDEIKTSIELTDKGRELIKEHLDKVAATK